MGVVNNQNLKRSMGAPIQVVLLLMLALFSQASHALLLQIDPLRSEIRSKPPIQFCMTDPTGWGVCPDPTPPQTFTVAGNIDANVFELDGNNQLQLTIQGLSTDALGEGFYLGTLLGPMSGDAFNAQHSCLFFPGFCSEFLSGLWWGESNGTWDGHTLIWSGHLPSLILIDGLSPAVDFTITATAVPEPGTLSLVLLILPLAYFGFISHGRGFLTPRAINR